MGEARLLPLGMERPARLETQYEHRSKIDWRTLEPKLVRYHIGHGQQLARSRLADKLAANGGRLARTPLVTESRQVRRRKALRQQKAGLKRTRDVARAVERERILHGAA